MKKGILVMLGLVAGTASFAQETTPQTPAAALLQTRVIATPDQKIKLFVQPQSTKGEITLRDDQGHPLYTETVSLKNGLGQQFDITRLGVGTYKLTVATSTETVTKTFIVQPVQNTTFVVVPA